MEDNKQTLPVEDSTDGQKTFTQEEVNSMIQKRLSREKGELAQKEQSLAQREEELKQKEFRYQVIDLLKEKKLPESLAEALNCKDLETANKSIEIIENFIEERKKSEPPAVFKGAVPAGHPRKIDSGYSPIRSAMGLS